MQNFTPQHHCKRARVSIDFQRSDDVKRAASYNTAALKNATWLQSAFIPQAVQNFVLNLFAATAQILLNLCARQCKFHFKILCRSSAASTLAPQNISQMYPPRAVKTRLHKTPRAKQLCRAVHDPSVFGVRHGYSRCKSVAVNDNLSTLRIDLQSMKSFYQCTHAASQVRSNFFRLRSRKMFHIGAARFKIQVRCSKF